jgi:cephalosporin hydroxylase
MKTITEIAKKYFTDKGIELIHEGRNIAHGYSVLYDRYFGHMRNDTLNILEIGLGDAAGSAFLWAEVFPNAQIYMADYDHNKINRFMPQVPKNVHMIYADQSNRNSLNNLSSQIPNNMDIIIDDGSHKNDHIILSFDVLFPKLKDGGVYIIEDTYQSYTESGETPIMFFKDIIDRINDYLSDKKDIYGINSIHFYRNLILVFKGEKITK